MKTIMTIQTRIFPVTIRDGRTGGITTDAIILTKEQLQAAQLVGQSSKELIHRLYDRAGCTVFEIGKAEKREITLNLEELYRVHTLHQLGKREKVEV